MRKDYFHELGEYDEEMDVWGAENVSFSIESVALCRFSLHVMVSRFSG